MHSFPRQSAADHLPTRELSSFEGHVCLRRCLACFALLACLGLLGCGTTKSYTATEQLLVSDAVDSTVTQIDFSPLAGRKVYFDSTYIKTLKSPLLVDSDYVISSMRQQMVAAGVRLVESRTDADVIAEGRIGALGLDGHNVTYGLPASNAISTATSVFSSTPLLPSFPEVSFARHEAKTGAAKLAVFAYDRETRTPVWQSGVARSSSSASDTWVLGVGPWQRGTIYEGTQFAGSKLDGNLLSDAAGDSPNPGAEPMEQYLIAREFTEPAALPDTSNSVQLASAEETAEQDGAEDKQE